MKQIREITSRTMVAILIAMTAAPPHLLRADSPPAAAPNATATAPAYEFQTLLGATLGTISSKYERIMSKIPSATIDQIQTRRATELEAEVQKRLKGINDGTISPSQLRAEVLTLNEQALKDQKTELRYQIRNLSAEQLERIAETMKGKDRYAEALAQYKASYKQSEKANAIADAVFQDLDNQFSVAMKKSVFMTPESWAKDLSGVKAAYNGKGVNWKKLLLFTAAGVAAAGLISWGVANKIYSGRYNRTKDQLEKDYANLKSQLEADYNGLEQRLTDEEKAYLQNNGFVYTTCGSYERPNSILCNRYQYQLFTGVSYCTVSCYKSTVTGKETMHSAPTCTSPFIPADCYDPSEYQAGYNDGYYGGYNDGVHDGGIDGDADGRKQGYDDGWNDGDSDGYHDGYNDGFDKGYSDYYNSPLSLELAASRLNQAPLNVFSLRAKSPAYQKGYELGLNDGKLLRARR